MHLREVVDFACCIQASRLVDVHKARRHIESHSEVVSHLKVEVGAEVEATIEIVAVNVRLVATEVAYQTALAEITYRSKVFQTIGTARYVHIGILLHCRLLEDFVIPVHIGVTIRVATVLKLHNVVTSKLRRNTIVGISFVYKYSCVI